MADVSLTPALILAMWAAGVAAGGALVGWWQIVGRGYLWLAAGVVALTSLATAAAGGGESALLAAVLGAGGALAAGSRAARTILFAAAAALLIGVALADSSVLPVLTGCVVLGGVSTEMMLGHWYLVDPTLPRWPLLSLDGIGAAGLVGDVVVVALSGSLTFSGADAMFTLVYLGLAGFTALLLGGVWFSLKEPGYSGVMASTGLSYLAVLTSFGVVTIGRTLVSGGLG